jgi:hypothetical protein
MRPAPVTHARVRVARPGPPLAWGPGRPPIGLPGRPGRGCLATGCRAVVPRPACPGNGRPARVAPAPGLPENGRRVVGGLGPMQLETGQPEIEGTHLVRRGSGRLGVARPRPGSQASGPRRADPERRRRGYGPADLRASRVRVPSGDRARPNRKLVRRGRPPRAGRAVLNRSLAGPTRQPVQSQRLGRNRPGAMPAREASQARRAHPERRSRRPPVSRHPWPPQRKGLP